MFTTSVSAVRIVGAADDISETEKTKTGGSALTENTELAVIATGPRPASAVITAMPLGCWRNAALNSSALRPPVSVSWMM